MNPILLDVHDLKVHFARRNGEPVRAVDGVHLRVARAESVGLVGESGCGKTTLGNAVIGEIPPTRGTVEFDGAPVAGRKGPALKAYRRQVQMIFQDPLGSLNPRGTIGSAIAEVLHVHRLARRGAETADRIAELLDAVGLDPAYAARYPHEFSGGQRQRVGIARALAVRPSLIVADEPVSALDVSVQVQILNLMKRLKEQEHIAFLFIAHDLAVVRYMCDRVCVMYLGRIVESAPVDELYLHPAHPYTEALLSAVPDVGRGLRARTEGSKRIVLHGDVPSPVEVIPGCPFHPRCHRAQPLCRERVPPTVGLANEHTSACHFAAELAGESVREPLPSEDEEMALLARPGEDA